MEIVPHFSASAIPKTARRSLTLPMPVPEDDGESEQKKHRRMSSDFDSLPWKEMFDGAAHYHREQQSHPEQNSSHSAKNERNANPIENPETIDIENEKNAEGNGYGGQMTRNPELRLALYIAMAHAGLVLSLAAVYGVGKLLEEYWTPIQWAVLCSMPLREIQGALVEFWAHPLKLGLIETMLAIPVAIYEALAGTVQDLQAAVFRLARRGEKDNVSCENKMQEVGFSKLLRWLVCFALFVLTYERLGPAVLAVFAFAGFILYAARQTLEESNPGQTNVASTLSVISMARHARSRRVGNPRLPIWSRASRYLTRCVLKRLHTLVAIWLITMMIVGSLAGVLFFSYKIGVEGKDAVMSLKEHVQKSNYAERVGLKQWINDNDIPELMDTYTVKFYETVSQQIDAIALQYNMTELAQSFKHYLIRPVDSSSSSAPAIPSHPITRKIQSIRLKAEKREFRAIYTELEAIFREFQISREELMEKAKRLAVQSLDVAKRVYASSTLLLAGTTNLVLAVGVSIASGAAGIMNFLSQSMVFFWLLYYLITSKSGGVMDHVLDMLPVSKSTRSRCAKVLDHAVSSVLLATAKVAFFQAAETWLLFRLFRIHFLYMSTFLAFTSALLPIIPPWLSSVPAGVQLAVEGRYVEGIILTISHLWIMDYGVTAIQCDVPGQNAYLTGLSILGGMALFSSALEGAIMGPLIMTFMMALKNLYCEFVLAAAKEANG